MIKFWPYFVKISRLIREYIQYIFCYFATHKNFIRQRSLVGKICFSFVFRKVFLFHVKRKNFESTFPFHRIPFFSKLFSSKKNDKNYLSKICHDDKTVVDEVNGEKKSNCNWKTNHHLSWQCINWPIFFSYQNGKENLFLWSD